MAWVYLVVLALVLWGARGGVIAIGRRLWSLDTTLRVHLVGFRLPRIGASQGAGPRVRSGPRALAITGLVMALDALVVAPLFEHSYAMFRSVIGTWLPFGLIFVASWAAGIWVPIP
jgi:hypothetical protein